MIGQVTRRRPPDGAVLLLAALGGLVAAALLRRSLRRPPGLILRVATGRPDFLAFAVCGRIDRAAIHGMADTMNRAFRSFAEVDVLVDLRRYRGATPGAIFDPLALMAEIRSLGHVRRYAVVGPPAWAGAMINLLDPLLPVEARTFAAEDLDRAIHWAQGPLVNAQSATG